MTTRREALVALAALAVVPGCGGGGGTDTGGGGTDTGGGGGSCSSNISDNHGHTLSVPRADVTAGSARSYDIRGSSPHTHSVDLSAADFALIASAGSVIVTSSMGGAHAHMVTVTCS